MDYSTPGSSVHGIKPVPLALGAQSLNHCTFREVHDHFQFSLVAHSCPILCDPMDCSTADFPVHLQLPELTQTHLHLVIDAIQPSHPLQSPSPPAFSLPQHQGLFQ